VDGQEQIQQVYAASSARLVAQLFAVTGDFAEAQDAVHEAFVRALVRRGRLHQVDNPEAWLRTVALNVARSRYRRRAIFDRIVRSGQLGRPDRDSPGLSPDHVALVTALQRLPRAIRETLVLYHIADLPVTEVARALDCSVEAVKTRLVRGRRTLAGQLGESGPPEAVLVSPAVRASDEGIRHA
jgi:RNA polymerase sigma factor (sigma-70 family)